MIINAGLDLSIGSVLTFSSVVAAQVMIEVGGNTWATIAAGLAAALASGAAWGLINGLLVARLRLNPLIVTLATLGMALGLAQTLTDGINITQVPLKASEIGTGRLGACLTW